MVPLVSSGPRRWWFGRASLAVRGPCWEARPRAVHAHPVVRDGDHDGAGRFVDHDFHVLVPAVWVGVAGDVAGRLAEGQGDPRVEVWIGKSAAEGRR